MWVWPRSVHAQLLEQLNKRAIKALAFDILFSEQDVYRPDADEYLNEVIARSTNTYFAALQQASQVDSGMLLKQLAIPLAMQRTNLAQPSAKASFVLPLAIKPDYWQVGTINFTADFDGIGRSYDVFRNIKGWLMPSLAAKIVVGLNLPLPDKSIIQLQWRGDAQQPFTTYSYADVYQAVINNDSHFLAQFDDKIILIGASASGLYDARLTAINHNLPGVYLLAMAIDNLKNQRYLQTVSQEYSLLLGAILILLISACFIYIKNYVKQLSYALLFIIFSSFSLGLFAKSLLLQQQMLFIGVVIGFMVVSFLTFSLFYGFLEYQRRQKTLTMFGRFLHPHMVHKLLTDNQLSPEKLNKTQEVTVLFSDIRNFTQLSESKSAEAVLLLLNDYFEQQLQVIFKHNGTLDKFIGDCLMAFWGAPMDDPNHAVSAIDAALSMEQALLNFKQTLPKELATFEIGIGIHTGECIVGMVGAKSRLDYTVIGDTVNLASRIEGLTKNNHRILVSQRCKVLAEHVYNFEFSGEHHVKGRSERVKLYYPTSRKFSITE
jgi:adenylate cyclase